MAVDIAATCTALHARYTQIIGKLNSLPIGGSIGEGGRSISAQAVELRAQLDLVRQEAAALGCSIGTLAEPFVLTSRARS